MEVANMTSAFSIQYQMGKGRIMKATNGCLTTLKRVLVVDNHSILGASVEKLLSNSKQLQIAGIIPQSELALIEDIWRFMPDVIVLSGRSQLTNPARLLSSLKNYRSFRLIVISENDNTIEVYEKRQITVKEQNDLMEMVQ